MRYTDPTGHAFCEDCNDGGDYNDGGDTGSETGGDPGCGANDLDCDGVTDALDQAQAPAETGEDQGPEEDGEDSSEQTEVQVTPLLEAIGYGTNPVCPTQGCFLGLSFSWLISTDWLDPSKWLESTNFYYGGVDLLWVQDTGEFGLFKFGALTDKDYYGKAYPIQAGISLTGMLGQGMSRISDYEGKAHTDAFGLGPIAGAGTYSVSNPNLGAFELGAGWSLPIPITFSSVEAEWEPF